MKKLIIVSFLFMNTIQAAQVIETLSDTELNTRLYTKLKKLNPASSYSQLLPKIITKINEKRDIDTQNQYNDSTYKYSFENKEIDPY